MGQFHFYLNDERSKILKARFTNRGDLSGWIAKKLDDELDEHLSVEEMRRALMELESEKKAKEERIAFYESRIKRETALDEAKKNIHQETMEDLRKKEEERRKEYKYDRMKDFLNNYTKKSRLLKTEQIEQLCKKFSELNVPSDLFIKQEGFKVQDDELISIEVKQK